MYIAFQHQYVMIVEGGGREEGGRRRGGVVTSEGPFHFWRLY